MAARCYTSDLNDVQWDSITSCLTSKICQIDFGKIYIDSIELQWKCDALGSPDTGGSTMLAAAAFCRRARQGASRLAGRRTTGLPNTASSQHLRRKTEWRRSPR